MYTLDPVSESDIVSATQQSPPEATPAAVAPAEPPMVTTPIEGTTPAEQDASTVRSDSSQAAAKRTNGSTSDADDVEMEDSVTPAEKETIGINPTETAVNEDQTNTPPTRAIPFTPSFTGVQVATNTSLGLKYLVETPPTLLSKDEDVRPEWLAATIKIFLRRFVPCFGNLGKVVDLFLAQEARLGYPTLVRTPLLSWFSALTLPLSRVAFHCHPTTGRPRSRGS